MRVNIGMPVVRMDGRSVGHMITKFSGMGRFISHGAPLARFARGAPLLSFRQKVLSSTTAVSHGARERHQTSSM